MAVDLYPIISIQPSWILEPEALGSKEKFWYREPKTQGEKESDWLFKYSQQNTGQHWAEKIAAEVAKHLLIYHAPVELAEFNGLPGSTTQSFARDGRELFHGNQVMARHLMSDYDPNVRFRQSQHTLRNIFLSLDKMFVKPEGSYRAKTRIADYLVLDAVIGNTDRHHENWGVLLRAIGDEWKGSIAPSFDHASSLGRELLDDKRQRFLKEDRVGPYAKKGRGGIYLKETDERGASPLDVVRDAAASEKDVFSSALEKIHKLDLRRLSDVIDRVPPDWMSTPARQFALAFMRYSVEQLKVIPL